MSCVYGCKKDGTPCPRPHTCHTLGPKPASKRAIEELDSDIGDIVLDGIAASLIVWLVAFVFAPALAGYLTHMRW